MAVFDLEAVIKLNDSGFKTGLSKVGKTLGTFGKVAGAAIAAGSVAVAGLVKQSVSAYAEYEQLAGGVQKLFGAGGKTLDQYATSVGKTVTEAAAEWAALDKAQRTVMDNANQAFITTGQSANEYIDTVTGISAALINSYGGDTVKAAEQADKAMRAISDNFNTFGGDIESVKSAYQGFAKQNYTMLDNLKLGYGGTKTEMERLIADANTYREELGLTGDLTIDKYGDIVEAIDLIQQKQGIAGTTAKEAAKTISGSLNMTKAAWKNLVRAFSDKDADLGQYFNALVTSAETAFENIMPVVEQALTGIGDFITEMAPVIGEKLPGLISEGLPKLVKAGATLVSSLATGIAQALPELVSSLPEIFGAIKDGFVEAWPAMKEAGGQLLTMAGEGMKVAGEKLREVSGQIWENVKGAAAEKWEQTKAAAAGAWESIKSGVSEKWEGIKGAVASAWESVKDGTAWTSISEKASEAWSAISGTVTEAWAGISSAVSSAWETVKSSPAWTSISSKASEAWSAIQSGVSSGWASIRSEVIIAWGKVKSAVSWSSIASLAEGAWNGIKSGVAGAWAAIQEAVTTAVEPVVAAVSGPIDGLVGAVDAVWSAISGAVEGAWATILEAVTSAVAPVVSAVTGPFEAIVGTVEGVWSSITGGIAGAFAGIKEALEAAIAPIKAVMDFSWSWPSISLPKLPTLKVETASAFGGAITYPKLSWAAKAMENPYLFSGATLFGAGEVGDEVLYGRNALLSDISHAVGISNDGLALRLDALLNVLTDYLPEAAKRPVVLDTGALVGGIGHAMDMQLGDYSVMGGRELSLA